jgi:riboflavin synthase
MFTGIVTDIGIVRAVRDTNRDLRFEIATAYDLTSVDIGASISHSGCCLTVVDKGPDWFAVEVSGETLALTHLGDWGVGRRVNLERAAKVTPEGGSRRVRFRAPRPLHRFIAPKGSITVDGVSLTVNEVEDDLFGVNLIPHTWDVTTLGDLAPGMRVNLEIDMLARYLARWRETA